MRRTDLLGNCLDTSIGRHDAFVAAFAPFRDGSASRRDPITEAEAAMVRESLAVGYGRLLTPAVGLNGASGAWRLDAYSRYHEAVLRALPRAVAQRWTPTDLFAHIFD